MVIVPLAVILGIRYILVVSSYGVLHSTFMPATSIHALWYGLIIFAVSHSLLIWVHSIKGHHLEILNAEWKTLIMYLTLET